MLYSDSILFLKTKFKSPSFNFKFSDEENKAFFKFVRKDLKDTHDVDDNAKDEIKELLKITLNLLDI